MEKVLWIKLTNEIIPLLLLLMTGFVTYNGFKKNQKIISEKEGLIKRYILFRGDKQARLKIYENDEQIHKELLKNISNSWKNFKKSHDQYVLNLLNNIKKTKRFLIILTLGFIINSGRLIGEEYYFFGIKRHLLFTILREIPNYIFIVLSYLILKTQTQKYFSLKSEVLQNDRGFLFFANSHYKDQEYETLYNEFDPIYKEGDNDGK